MNFSLHKSLKGLCIYLAALVPALLTAIELLSWKWVSLGRIGNYLWLISFIFPIAFLIAELRHWAGEPLRSKPVATFAALLLLGGLFFHRSNSIDTSRPATWEIQCVLRQVESSPDAGFHQTCNYGNPSRQFLLPALPSMLLSRSPFALALGYSSYFFLGILAFATGALRYLGKGIKSDLVVSASLLLLLCLPEFWRLTCLYEQVNFPICFALITIGFFLHYASSLTLHTLSILGIAILHACFAYHPTLALFLGSVPALGYVAFGNRIQKSCKIYTVQFAAASIAMFVSSLAFRNMEIANKAAATAPLWEQIGQFLKFLLWQKNSPLLLSPLFHQLFLFILLMALFFAFRFRGFAMGCWIIAALAFSVFSKGNWNYEIINIARADRANVAVPVILALILMCLKTSNFHHFSSKPLIAGLLLVLLSGVSVHQQLECRDSNWDGRIMQIIGGLTANNRHFTIYIEPGLPSWGFDQFSYYFPEASQVVLNEDCSAQSEKEGAFFLISANGRCSKLNVPPRPEKAIPVKMSGQDLLILTPGEPEKSPMA